MFMLNSDLNPVTRAPSVIHQLGIQVIKTQGHLKVEIIHDILTGPVAAGRDMVKTFFGW